MYRLGIDIGGTFTDALAVSTTGEIVSGKVPSTPKDPSAGVLQVLQKIATESHLALHDLLSNTSLIVHGTTISVNAILTKTGAKTAVLTTRNFRDILGIRYGFREDPFAYKSAPPDPIVPRQFTIGIQERVDAEGRVLVKLDENQVIREIRKLQEKVDSIAVCYLWSFRNDAHEKRTRKLVKANSSHLHTSLSSEVLPTIKEFERFSTTVLDAYLSPLTSDYIRRFERLLNSNGYGGQLLIVQPNGGVMTSDVAVQRAVSTVQGGRAAGTLAGLELGLLSGFHNIVAIEMGGTTFDVCVIKDRSLPMIDENWIGGFYIGLPFVETKTLGAGGGSLAWIDEGGMLRVGPNSAGAEPGPACYGKGGKEVSLTDCDLILGYLNADYFLGGEMKLDANRARDVLAKRIADPMGIDIEDAAFAIRKIAESNMVEGIIEMTIRRGENPSDFSMVAAGGAGPVHSARLAQELGIKTILIPKMSAVYCSLGMLLSNLRHDYILTIGKRTDELDIAVLEENFAQLEEKGKSVLLSEGVPKGRHRFLRFIDLRYVGQHREVSIEFGGPVSDRAMQRVFDTFHRRHLSLYGYNTLGAKMEVLNIRVAAIGRIEKIRLNENSRLPQERELKPSGFRKAYFEEKGVFFKTPAYRGENLCYGDHLSGPTIIEEPATTVIVPPRFDVDVDSYGNYVLHSDRAGSQK